MSRIGIIVVHGIGEQKRFEHLEEIACQLYRAARFGPNKRESAHIQLRRGNQAPRLSEEESWLDSPAIVSWETAQNEEVEVCFREVHWAGLDMEMSWSRWFKFVGWALSVSGVRLFSTGIVGAPGRHGMRPPAALSWRERLIVRLQLFLTSLAFLFILVTIDALYGLVTRLNFRARMLNKARRLIYDYLGDVKLYQDWFERSDNHLEVIGEKSRVAIRRRMIRTLVQTASEVEKGTLDGYFVFAHSLGTVVAFNGLMETELALSNYLTKEEWLNPDYAFLKTTAAQDAPPIQMPRRPAWLLPRDALSRAELFRGLKGFLTMGSPLDKFAALWPATVPINLQSLPHDVPWFNVADTQDIVAGELDLYCPPGNRPPCGVGGLQLHNVKWTDQMTLFTAHTSYWKANKSARLIDQIVSWIESPASTKLQPENAYPEWLARALFWLSLLSILLILPLALALTAWLMRKDNVAGEPGGSYLHQPYQVFSQVRATLDGIPWAAILEWAAILVFMGALIVVAFSTARRLWEEDKFGREENP